MILNITTSRQPVSDLGYLLHKHLDRFQTVNLSFGKAHVFYPEHHANKISISLLFGNTAGRHITWTTTA